MTFPHMAGNAARRVSTFALCAVLGFSALAMTTGAHSAAAATDDGGIDISITVATPTPTPAVLTPAGGTGTGTGTGNGTLPSTGTGVGRGNSGPTATTTTETSPSTGTGDLGEDSTSLGGAVLLSGLTSSYDPSLNPLGGSLEVKFTVRNISDEPIDASAKFWLTTLIGTKISTEVKDVVGLEAGQSRVVTARLPGVGQWTVVTAHMTFTPPAEVGGVKLVPVSRDRIVFAEPWLLFTILLVAAGAYGVSYVLRSARTVRLPRVTA
ncbi:hypothetical protein B0I08_106103 [Glaciihabitans tibetensis]|uniref:Uncharacterized protein n=2 Tax=Glaciihabitans tibetensis TaxID=1266600 RepID=A0A2T0VBB7_9MICO|nr:hypothetical protein B0I08_106103 [Glaciihabitans tibetensis]